MKYSIAESFSARVSELTHPKLPIYSFEIYDSAVHTQHSCM